MGYITKRLHKGKKNVCVCICVYIHMRLDFELLATPGPNLFFFPSFLTFSPPFGFQHGEGPVNMVPGDECLSNIDPCGVSGET